MPTSNANPAPSESDPKRADEVRLDEVTPAVEFACWVVVGLAPLLRWVNGPAVTDDQFVIQIALTATALVGALGLRIYNYRANRRRSSPPQPEVSVPSRVPDDAP